MEDTSPDRPSLEKIFVKNHGVLAHPGFDLRTKVVS